MFTRSRDIETTLDVGVGVSFLKRKRVLNSLSFDTICTAMACCFFSLVHSFRIYFVRSTNTGIM